MFRPASQLQNYFQLLLSSLLQAVEIILTV